MAYLQIPPTLHTAITHQIARHGTELAAELAGIPTKTLLAFSRPQPPTKSIKDTTLDKLVTHFHLDPTLLDMPEVAPPQRRNRKKKPPTTRKKTPTMPTHNPPPRLNLPTPTINEPNLTVWDTNHTVKLTSEETYPGGVELTDNKIYLDTTPGGTHTFTPQEATTVALALLAAAQQTTRKD